MQDKLDMLRIKKMKLDKFFTIFLDSVQLKPDNYESPEWITYHEMLKEYDKVQNKISSLERQYA
jgi:hypothetical protein